MKKYLLFSSCALLCATSLSAQITSQDEFRFSRNVSQTGSSTTTESSSMSFLYSASHDFTQDEVLPATASYSVSGVEPMEMDFTTDWQVSSGSDYYAFAVAPSYNYLYLLYGANSLSIEGLDTIDFFAEVSGGAFDGLSFERQADTTLTQSFINASFSPETFNTLTSNTWGNSLTAEFSQFFFPQNAEDALLKLNLYYDDGISDTESLLDETLALDASSYLLDTSLFANEGNYRLVLQGTFSQNNVDYSNVLSMGYGVPTASAVPEPSTYGIFGAIALLGLIIVRRKI